MTASSTEPALRPPAHGEVVGGSTVAGRTVVDGDRVRRPDRPGAGHRRHRRRAADVVAPYMAAQRDAVLAGDQALRLGDDGAVHATRVALRRFRSTLRVCRDLFDPERADALDRELRWYAGLLGEVRDRQVLRGRLASMVAEVDPTLLLGPVKDRLDAELRADQAGAWDRLRREMGSDRYRSLLADLDGWVDQPPWTPAAGRSRASVAKLVRAAEHSAARRLRRAGSSPDLAALHRARKAAKRARYAAEMARPVMGARASRQARRYRALQEVLGEHQDSMVSAAFLRRVGAVAGVAAGENGFSFGLLHQREVDRARRSRKQALRLAR